MSLLLTLLWKPTQTREDQKTKSPKIEMLQGRWGDSKVVDRAWQHVLTKSGDNHSETEKTYKNAVMALKDEISAVSYITIENPHSGDEYFLKTMIEQGCFILQVALCSLGGSKALDYPPNDPIFGSNWDKQKIREWVTSMFGIRKQIPLVVLQVLMKQSFFKKVVMESGKWNRPQDLARMTLYDFLVVPILDEIAGERGDVKILKRVYSFINGRGNFHQNPPPTLLHALWSLLTGPGNGRNHEIKSDEGVNGDYNSAWFTVRSANELQKAGITFRNSNGLGIRGIQLKKRMLNASLSLPSISIEPKSTELLLENLILYEQNIYSDENKHEVSGYVQFMRELIRSPSDVKLLARQGVIHGDPREEEKLPEMLGRLHITEMANNRNLGIVRRQIRVYVKPNGWEMVANLLRLTLLLTLLQTIYTVLGYYQSKNNK